MQNNNEQDPHLQVELSTLSQEFTVAQGTSAAVKVQAPAVTAPLIGVEVHATRLGGGAADQVEPGVQLPQLVVAAATVDDDVDS